MSMRSSDLSTIGAYISSGDEEGLFAALQNVRSEKEIGGKIAVSDQIVKALKTAHSNRVRNAAALALVDIKAEGALPDIIALLRHRDILKSAGTLLFAVGELGGFLPIEIVVNLIEQGSYESKSEALGFIDEGRLDAFTSAQLNEAIERLSKLSESTNEEISQAAAIALSKLDSSVRFNQLSAAFSKWRHNYFEMRNTGLWFASLFSRGFRSFIGAPEYFEETHLHKNPGERMPYVRIRKAILDEKKQTFESIEPETYFDTLTFGHQDEYFYFSLETALEMGPNTWPKQYFPVLISFKADRDDYEVRVTTLPDGTFKVNPREEKTFVPAFEFICNLLMKSLVGTSNNAKTDQTLQTFVPYLVPTSRSGNEEDLATNQTDAFAT